MDQFACSFCQSPGDKGFLAGILPKKKKKKKKNGPAVQDL